MIKNLQAWKVSWEGVTPEALEEHLKKKMLPALGPLETESAGFLPVLEDVEGGGDAMTFVSGKCVLISAAFNKKVVPAVVVKKRLQERIQEIEQQTGNKVKGKFKKQLKDEVMQELLPKAFVQQSKTLAYWDQDRSLIYVNSGSAKAGERIIGLLRDAVGTCPAQLADSPTLGSYLTHWVKGSEALPQGLVLGDSCELKEPVEKGAVIRAQRQQMDVEEIKKHIDEGKVVAKVAMIWEERLSFEASEDGIIRKIKWEKGGDGSDEPKGDDALQEFDGAAALVTLDLGSLWDFILPFRGMSSDD